VTVSVVFVLHLGPWNVLLKSHPGIGISQEIGDQLFRIHASRHVFRSGKQSVGVATIPRSLVPGHDRARTAAHPSREIELGNQVQDD